MSLRFVPIELDKPRRLRYDPNAIADVEGVLGMGLSRIFNEDMMGMRVMRALLWAGLRWEDRGLTLERAGNLIMTYVENGGDMGSLGEAIARALQAAEWLGKPNQSDEGNAMGA